MHVTKNFKEGPCPATACAEVAVGKGPWLETYNNGIQLKLKEERLGADKGD